MTTMFSIFEKLSIKIEHLWGLVILSGVFVFVNTHPIRPNDFWFHLAYGRLIVENKGLPVIDTFSFTMYGQPYEFAHNYWLAQVFMYWLFECGGAEWTIFVFSIFVTVAYAIIFFVTASLTQNWRIAAFIALFSASLGISNWNIRPQTLIYLLAVLSVLGIERFRRHGYNIGWGLFLIVIMALWVNSHGTFFIPLVLAAAWQVELFWLASSEKKWQILFPGFQLLLFLLVGVLINPRGYKVFSYLFTLITAPSVQGYVSEWQPADLSSLPGVVFLIMAILLFSTWAISGRKITLSETISLVFFLLLGLRYERAIVWFGITQVPLILAFAQQAMARYDKAGALSSGQNLKINFFLALLVVVLSLFSLPWLKTLWPLSPEKQGLYSVNTPVKAVNFLMKKPLSDRVFSDMAFSSYITWAAHGKYKVFVDPRFDLYPESLWADYLLIGAAQNGWPEKLYDYDIDTLLLSPETQQRLVLAVRRSPDWEQIYQDEVSMVFVRRGWQNTKNTKP